MASQPLSDAELLALHHAHSWPPFTQMKLAADPVLIERGEGVWLETRDGRRIIDAVGSWWVNIHGHNHPYINQKITDQLKNLEHCIYAGLSHEPGLTLSKRLAESTQNQLPRVFFSDNGSTAVEIGLKMAFQFFSNQGRTEKREFVCLADGYHGDTIGAMAVGARSTFHEMYAPLLFPARQIPAPRCSFAYFHQDDSALDALAESLGAFEEMLAKDADKICAIILEPVVQGAAAGFNMYPPVYLKRVRELCDQYGVFLIADEVYTGIGRTGEFYACEHAGIWPDILCLSKGLSGGYLPFAATLAAEKVYQGFYSDNRMHTLFHGHSMTGNPLGCAAAHASLDLCEERDVRTEVRNLEHMHREGHTTIMAGPIGKRVRESRTVGSAAALELDLDERYTSELGWKLMARSIEKGVLLRPLGRVLYTTPAYVINQQEIEQIYDVMETVLREILD